MNKNQHTIERVMEAKDHFNNAAILKSLMSSGNFKITKIVSCLTLIFTFMACTQPNNTVRGYIEGLSNDTVFVRTVPLEREAEPLQDTVIVKNGRFEFTFPDDGAYQLAFSFLQFYVRNRPTGGLYAPDNSRLILFAEPGDKINVRGGYNSGGLNHVIISGSKLNQNFSSIQNQMFEIRKNEIEEEMALEQAIMDRNKELADQGWEKRMERLNTQRELRGNYIRSNLDNPLSAYLLSQQPLDSVDFYYDKLGINARNLIFRPYLDSQMKQYQAYIEARKALKAGVVGNKAPDFTLEDMDGNPFSLSLLRGKYVMIDFWGSWCGPCISGIPKMKRIYEKYKNKLEILGVACREESADVWREAVKRDELPWINLYNDDLSAVHVKYGIEVYPTKIVIDSEGTILIHERGEGEDFYTKLEHVME